MADRPKSDRLLTAADIGAARPIRMRHPLNQQSDARLVPLGELLGLLRVRLTLARVPPGKESFAFHAHAADEEFVTILSGRGRARIGEDAFEVGPGDFMAFPVPSVAHHLSNPYDEDLVYLMGGERSRAEIGTFPDSGKRIIFTAGGIWQVDEQHLEPLGIEQWMADDRDDDQST